MKSILFTLLLYLVILSMPACQDDDTTPTTAGFEVSNEQLWANCPIEFINTSLGATSYIWDFGDGNTATEENPTHHYANPGTYTVTLTASWTTIQDIFIRTVQVNQNTTFEYNSYAYDGYACKSVVTIPGEGYVVGGSKSSEKGGNHKDIYLMKTDANGNAQWEKTFGGNGYDEANAIQLTDNCGYIVAGSYDGDGFYLIKTDDEGSTN